MPSTCNVETLLFVRSNSVRMALDLLGKGRPLALALPRNGLEARVLPASCTMLPPHQCAPLLFLMFASSILEFPI
jgi:hypothetical protein